MVLQWAGCRFYVPPLESHTPNFSHFSENPTSRRVIAGQREVLIIANKKKSQGVLSCRPAFGEMKTIIPTN